MNKKLALAVLFFSTVTIATLTLSILFLQKIYMLTSKKSPIVGIVLTFIIGVMAGVYTYKKKRRVRPR